MNVTSINLTILDFEILYDLSTIAPTIRITNTSTGSNMAACTWWIKIVDPAGIVVHEGSFASPDKLGVWSTWDLPGVWPQLNNQIVWSGVPYLATLFVSDGDTPPKEFELTLDTRISRPKGNTTSSTDNFAVADVYSEMRCAEEKLFVEDRTNYTYNGILGGAVSQLYTLVYPMDPTGAIPTPATIVNASAGIFDVTFDDPCYQLNLATVMSYSFSNRSTVKIKYKYKSQINVNCNTGLCEIMCAYEKMVNIPDNCSANTDLMRINGLLMQILVAKMEPNCSIDIPAKISEIKNILDTNCNC